MENHQINIFHILEECDSDNPSDQKTDSRSTSPVFISRHEFDGDPWSIHTNHSPTPQCRCEKVTLDLESHNCLQCSSSSMPFTGEILNKSDSALKGRANKKTISSLRITDLCKDDKNRIMQLVDAFVRCTETTQNLETELVALKKLKMTQDKELEGLTKDSAEIEHLKNKCKSLEEEKMLLQENCSKQLAEQAALLEEELKQLNSLVQRVQEEKENLQKALSILDEKLAQSKTELLKERKLRQKNVPTRCQETQTSQPLKRNFKCQITEDRFYLPTQASNKPVQPTIHVTMNNQGTQTTNTVQLYSPTTELFASNQQTKTSKNMKIVKRNVKCQVMENNLEPRDAWIDHTANTRINNKLGHKYLKVKPLNTSSKNKFFNNQTVTSKDQATWMFKGVRKSTATWSLEYGTDCNKPRSSLQEVKLSDENYENALLSEIFFPKTHFTTDAEQVFFIPPPQRLVLLDQDVVTIMSS